MSGDFKIGGGVGGDVAAGGSTITKTEVVTDKGPTKEPAPTGPVMTGVQKAIGAAATVILMAVAGFVVARLEACAPEAETSIRPSGGSTP